MQTQHHEFVDLADALHSSIRDLLEAEDPWTRAIAVRRYAAGVDALERHVLLDANASGLSWAHIGEVYGVSRQAAHRRFSDETVVPSDFFDTLMADLDADLEVAPNLAKAAERVRRAATA